MTETSPTHLPKSRPTPAKCRELDKFGVKVLKTTITDLAPARVLKVIQSTSTNGL